jgi:hypothetical protein
MAILSDNNIDKSILYSDLPLTDATDVNGSLQEPINSEALSQAIKIWLASAKGEKIRSSTGGWLLGLLAKPMTDDVASRIKQNIITGLSTEFNPPIEIVDIQVIPDKKNNKWVITVAGYNSTLNIGVNTYAVFDAQGTGI